MLTSERDERQDMETDELDGNEFGLLEWSVLCSSQGRQTRGRRILTVKRAHPRGDEKQKNLSVR